MLSVYYTGMTKIERAQRVLLDAEKLLVELATSAASERDYDGAATLLAVAREVNELPQRFRFGSGLASPNSQVSAHGLGKIIQPHVAGRMHPSKVRTLK